MYQAELCSQFAVFPLRLFFFKNLRIHCHNILFLCIMLYFLCCYIVYKQAFCASDIRITFQSSLDNFKRKDNCYVPHFPVPTCWNSRESVCSLVPLCHQTGFGVSALMYQRVRREVTGKEDDTQPDKALDDETVSDVYLTTGFLIIFFKILAPF